MWSHWTGQAIVCIDDNFTMLRSGEITPVKDQVYHIRRIYEARQGTAFFLTEIANEPRMYVGKTEPVECCFLKFRFRPVVDTKSDISLLTEIRDNPKFKIQDPTKTKTLEPV